MAGAYVDAPGRRMAWDDDGTQIYHRRIDLWDPFDVGSAGARAIWNDEENGLTTEINFGDNNNKSYVVVTFPEKRDVDAFYVGSDEGSVGVDPVWTTPDDNNAWNATWTEQIADHAWGGGVGPTAYRTAYTLTSYSAIRSIRWRYEAPAGGGSSYLYAMLLYGTIASAETPDRLLYVDNETGLVFDRNLDYGDLPRGSAIERDIVLRNNSATLDANTVQITAEDLAYGAGGWFTFSDGGAFAGTLLLGSSILATADRTIAVRVVVPTTQNPNPYPVRFQTSVGSWT